MSVSDSQLSYLGYINNDFIREIIRNGCHDGQDTEIQEYAVEPLAGGSGENYCSDIYEVNVRCHSPKDSDSLGREENLIVKLVQSQKLTTIKQLDIFNRERYFYENIMPQIQSLLTLGGNKWTLGPRFWYATTNPIETLAMENLTPLGFKLKSRQEGLDQAHSIVVMKKLAQYHALTYSMLDTEDHLRAVMERFAFGLVNTVSCKSKSFQALFRTQLEGVTEILQHDKEFVTVCQKLREYSECFEEKVLACVNPLQGQFNVLNHGDVWVNNLLFRYGADKEALPKEVRFIDFQLSFYGSPGYDVNYFLNTSVQLAVLRDHRQQLIETYVQSFLDMLVNVPPHSKDIPTAHQIAQEIQNKEPYGFFVAFAFLPLMCMNHKDSQDNSLDNLNDPTFAKRKIALMFNGSSRALDTFKYALKRLISLEML